MKNAGNYTGEINALLAWFRKNKHKTPWREDPTPYHVWVSEIMLQQTRIFAALPHYVAFIREFENPAALAEADDEKLLKAWEGLGYYSRVKNMKKTAQKLVDGYGGEFPKTYEELRALDGVGDYTAGAIASVCFGLPTPAVDGNVLRVWARYFADNSDMKKPAAKKKVESALKAVYPTGKDAGDFTEALMELGETVCMPNQKPACDGCPVKKGCQTAKTGKWKDYPVRGKQPERKKEERVAFVLTYKGKTGIRKRPESGLLADAWEVWNVLSSELPFVSADGVRAYLKENGVQAVSVEKFTAYKHVFSHIEWKVIGFIAEISSPLEGFTFVDKEDLKNGYMIPTAFRPLFENGGNKRK